MQIDILNLWGAENGQSKKGAVATNERVDEAITQQTDGEKLTGGETKSKDKKKVTRKPGKKKPANRKPRKPPKKRAQPKPRSKQQTAQEAETGGDKKPKPHKGNPFAKVRKTIKDHLPTIVDRMVQKAEGGSCTHAKTILEISGAKHMFDGEHQAKEKGEPWAKLVLQKLDEAEQETAGNAATDTGKTEGNG
ncbi:MAG: hypothetical protein P4M01_04915 [Acidobacteriota bacterium]|nr:hypothetical protein [Acidobacteriota bacterium]